MDEERNERRRRCKSGGGGVGNKTAMLSREGGGAKLRIPPSARPELAVAPRAYGLVDVDAADAGKP
ncbi:hypothetical protein ANO11243_039260 [Dothideomycetidae sp. 11243]|nr:hypothetical protein ANO11243_039260 [fungal sp. No.11243]